MSGLSGICITTGPYKLVGAAVSRVAFVRVLRRRVEHIGERDFSVELHAMNKSHHTVGHTSERQLLSTDTGQTLVGKHRLLKVEQEECRHGQLLPFSEVSMIIYRTEKQSYIDILVGSEQMMYQWSSFILVNVIRVHTNITFKVALSFAINKFRKQCLSN